MRGLPIPLLLSAALFAGVTTASAQFGRGGGDWMTSGADAQRSSWIRTDEKISKDSLQKPGFELLWKAKLPTNGAGLSDAVLLDRYIGYRGFRSLAFVGGAAGAVAAVDTDLNRIEWQRTLTTASVPGCAGSFVTLVTRPTTVEFPTAGVPRGFGRGGPAKSGVGQPYQGAVTLAAANAMSRAGGFPGRGRGPGMRMPTEVHALAADGMLHTMYVSNGEEPHPAMKFLPPGAAARGLIVVDNTAYAVTSDGCGVASGVWALNMKTGEVANWKAGSPVAGEAGIAFGPDGAVYVATGAGTPSVTVLEPKTLQVKAAYGGNAAFTSTPIVFQYRQKVLVAVASRDGRLHLLDSSSIGGADDRTPLSIFGPVDAKVSLATWQDATGTRRLAASGAKNVVAYRISDRNGVPTIESGWTSPDLDTPGPASVINNVVFVPAGTPAVIHALDASTGNPLWNSGRAIASAVNGAVSGGGGQIYVSGRDGVLYAFGFPMEH